MSIRTSGVGASRKLEFWDQYGVKKYDFSPTQMLTPGPVLFEFEHLLITDTDVTPVGNVLLKVVDKVPYFRNEADDADIILPEADIPHTFADLVTLAELAFSAGANREVSLLSDDKALMFYGGTKAGFPGKLSLFGKDETLSPGAAQLLTPNAAGDALVPRMVISGKVATAIVGWANTEHHAFKLGANLDANGFGITGLAATSFGDDVALGFGDGPEGLFVWDTTDPNAMLMKINVPTAAAGDVPALLVGIGIVGVNLAILDTITEPVMGVVDLDRDSHVILGFGADDIPELSCGGLATAIRLGVPFDMNANVIGGLGAPVAQDDALRKQQAEIIETDVDVTEIEVLSHKDVLNGYCPLDASVLVPLANIPTPLTGKDADSVDGADVGILVGDIFVLGVGGLIELARIPTPLTGKDADTVDGADVGILVGNLFVLGAGGLIELARIPTPLTGKDADTVDGVEGADIIVRGGTVAFTGDQSMAIHDLTNLKALTFDGADYRDISMLAESKGLRLWGGSATAFPGRIQIYGQNDAMFPGRIDFSTPNAAKDAELVRMFILGAADEVDINFQSAVGNTLVKGVKMGNDLDANTNKIKGLKAPENEGDALSLGDAVLSGDEAKTVANVNTTGGLPVVFRIDIADVAGDTDVTVDHKIRVIDAWAVKTGAAGGAGDNVTVKNAGAAITDAIDIGTPAVDKVLVRAAEIDDATHEIAGSGTLRVTAAKVTNCACTVYVLAIRVA